VKTVLLKVFWKYRRSSTNCYLFSKHLQKCM